MASRIEKGFGVVRYAADFLFVLSALIASVQSVRFIFDERFSGLTTEQKSTWLGENIDFSSPASFLELEELFALSVVGMVAALAIAVLVPKKSLR